LDEQYSLWEMGRAPDGRFSSMIPYACPLADSVVLGNIALGLGAVIATLQFACWYETRKMRELAQADREERRRIPWLNHIMDQWILEHRHNNGVRADITLSVAREAGKMLARLIELRDMDVPQMLLLKVKRLSDYFEDLGRFWSDCLRVLANASKSPEGWKIDTKMVLKEETDRRMKEFEHAGGGLWSTVHKYLGGPDHERALAFPELIRIQVSAEHLVRVFRLVNGFLAYQTPKWGTRLYLIGAGSNTTLLFGPDCPRSETWYRPVQRLALRTGIIRGLRWVPFGRAVIDHERCEACGKCAEIAPSHFGLSLYMKATSNRPALRIWVNKAYVKNRREYRRETVEMVKRCCRNSAITWQAAEEMGPPFLPEA